MTYENIKKIEDALHNRLKGFDLSTLAENAARLSHGFTKERGALPQNYMNDPKTRTAYLAHFFLTNAGKVLNCLETGSPPTACGDDNLWVLGDDKLRILDIGSGPGSAAIAASAFFAERFPEAKVEILCVDESREALLDAEKIFSALGNKNHTLKTKQCEISSKNLHECIEGRFDIIIAANFLNELGSPDEAFHVSNSLLSNNLGSDGILIVIDPALRETARPLMKLRDRLISENIASISAPCLNHKNCPMLAANERDWCHFYIEWQRPELIRKMDELVGTNHEYLKMAYFIFGAIRNTHDAQQYLWCVVSSPLISKGKIELMLCGANGELKKIMRQDKNSSDANADFDKAKRGDIVSCEAKTKIGGEDKFEIVAAWNG